MTLAGKCRLGFGGSIVPPSHYDLHLWTGYLDCIG